MEVGILLAVVWGLVAALAGMVLWIELLVERSRPPLQDPR